MISNIHRGPYIQHGRGFGGIFSSLLRVLKPLVSKGISLGKHAIKDSQVQSALSDIKNSAVKTGAKAITNKMESLNKKPNTQALKRAKKRVADVTNKRFKRAKMKKTIFS